MNTCLIFLGFFTINWKYVLNLTKPKEYVAGIYLILLVETRREYAATTKTKMTACSLRSTGPARLRQYLIDLISVQVSYFGTKYSFREASGNQRIPGRNMWPFPLCIHCDGSIRHEIFHRGAASFNLANTRSSSSQHAGHCLLPR